MNKSKNLRSSIYPVYRVTQCKSLSTNSHEGSNPSPLNTTTNYSHISRAESQQFRCFETTLAICLTCNLPPEQAVKEFKEAYGKTPPPLYFKWWQGCWDEFEITPEMVTAWLVRVNRKGWIERLGGAA